MASMASSVERGSPPWGWLEGADPKMPNVVLEGPGVAIGSSREGFEARRKALSAATTEAGAIQDPNPSRRWGTPSAPHL